MQKLLAAFTKNNKIYIRLLILAGTGLFALGILLLPSNLNPTEFTLKAGEVSTQEILAPYTLQYESIILTAKAKEDAENNVKPVYLPADPSITRQQLEKLKTTLAYVTTLKVDQFSTSQQRIDDLTNLKLFSENSETPENIFALSDEDWLAIQDEVSTVFQQVMRSSIREDQLEEARRGILPIINFKFNNNQSGIIVDLVSAFLTPTSLFSLEQTTQLKQQASQAITPILKTYSAGETLVRRGQIISDEIWEALTKYDLISSGQTLKDVFGALSLVVVLFSFVGLYFNRRKIVYAYSYRTLLLISITFLLFLLFARLTVPGRSIIPYLFPIPAFSLTLVVLFNLEIGLIFPLILSVLIGYGLQNSAEITIFYLVTSLCGVIILGKGRRVTNFFWAGVAVGIAGTALILAYRLPGNLTDMLGITTLSAASFVNGLASSSLALLMQFFYSQILGITTSLQLLELSRPDHPLSQFILRNAPGTYQHSLQVANIAEQAAEMIGADPILTRVGAIYHDAGKATNPAFFIENQMPGKTNPHNDLLPEESAEIIIAHVKNGEILANKYHLPPRIVDFMREHHGNLITKYQYAKALQAAGNQSDLINENKFRYPGPKPRSKETALLMLADGCEARARAEMPKNEEELRVVVKKVIDYCLREGQFDHTNLTFRDINLASESIVKTLQNSYHPRLQYPEIKPQNQS